MFVLVYVDYKMIEKEVKWVFTMHVITGESLEEFSKKKRGEQGKNGEVL